MKLFRKTLGLFCLVMLCCFFVSCKDADVAGKRFKHPVYPLTIEFDSNSNHVFFFWDLGTYTVNKDEIIITCGDKDTKLLYKEDAVYIYVFDKTGKQTSELNEEGLLFDGETDAFTNYFAGQEITQNNLKISFTEDKAKVGTKEIAYSFNPETYKYEVEGFESTHSRKVFLENVFSKFMDLVKDNSTSNLTYEKAWWLYQSCEDFEDLLGMYVENFYYDEYKSNKNDVFAVKRLKESKSAELKEKLSSLNKKEVFNITIPAQMGTYDFEDSAFYVGADLYLDNLKSKLPVDNTEIEVHLCKTEYKWGSLNNNWLSNINTAIYLPMAADKAETLNKKVMENNKVLLSFNVCPIEGRERNSWGETDYIINFEVVSAKLIDIDTLEDIGEVEITYLW